MWKNHQIVGSSNLHKVKFMDKFFFFFVQNRKQQKKEKQQILKFMMVEPADVWRFCLQKDWNY